MTSKELRAQAERVVRLTRREIDALAGRDIQQIVHELQVHQVELEMQNESLRLAQHATEESQAQYRELFESAPIGYVMVGPDQRILHANAAAEKLLNVALPNLCGKELLGFVAPADRRTVQTRLLDAELFDSTNCEVQLAGRNEPCHVRMDISPKPSQPSRRQITLTDVTEQKRSVDALEMLNRELEARVAARTLELEARNRALEREIERTAQSESQRRALEARVQETARFESLSVLAGGIAHDFNNLLVGVLGNAELLLVMPELAKACHEHIVSIKRAAREASELTRQLLVFAGQSRASLDVVKLPKIVAEALESLRTRLPSSVQLRVQIAADTPEILADRSQVSQLAMSLISNAIEAIDGRGAILLQTRVEQLDAEALSGFQHATTAEAGQFVILFVKDTGPGIEPNTLARIFDPFFSTKFAGRGLGLASVLGIVQGHHGALRVSSTVGAGTSFEVAFPTAERRAESERPRPLSDLEWKGSGPVLLVDDDDAVRSVVARMLVRLGFEVTAVDGGEAALDSFLNATPSFKLAVLDWIMPGFSGQQLLDALRALEPGLPILVISGYSAEDLATYDKSVVFVQKPMSLAQLRDALIKVLGHVPALAHN